MLHYALLDASLGTEHAKRNFERETDATLSVFEANEGELPPPVAGEETASGESGLPAPFDAVIISGSQSSVYDDEDWIAELATWVRSAIAADLPILGVCWGHQLLAELLGGRVEGGDYELGYVEVDIVEDDPIFDEIGSPFTVFATHSDHVVEMPAEATVLAENDVGVQAFRHENIYACQFHPEYDLRTAKAMIESKDLPLRDIQKALNTCTTENVRKAQQAKQIFPNFHDFVRNQKDAASAAAPEQE
jgi:GMP synthase (glutamine-hydrolysing)